MTYKISVIVPAYNEEKYLSTALDSLVNQTFKDFEVIIINDGSTDNTQKVIDKYTKKYQNFHSIYQENSGVSSSRNKGIEEAKGDYLAFLDGDDTYTPGALENLYNTAKKYNADLVLGRMKIINIFGSVVYVGPIKLSKMVDIDPLDKELIWTGSMCNKLFSRKKIMETGLRVPKIKYDEDGTFVISFALKCQKIVGCPHDIVIYHKRPFWKGYSVTQAITVEYINHHLEAYKTIESLVKQAFKEKSYNLKGNEKEELSKKYRIYNDELCHRRIAILGNEFYRYFWKANPESINLINNSLNDVKRNISPKAWAKDVEKFKDLRIDHLIIDKTEMANKPLVSIIINIPKIAADDLNFQLGSIYSQEFPAFEVIIPSQLSDLISDDFLDKENLRCLEKSVHTTPYLSDSELNKETDFKNKALLISKGKYIQIIEDNIFFEPRALRKMYNSLQDSDLDFVSMKMHQIKDEKLKEYPHQELAYSYRNTVENSIRSIFNYLDLYLSNKLIKMEYIEHNSFKFSRDSAQDVAFLYEHGEFQKLKDKFIFSHENEKKLIKSLNTKNKKVSGKINSILPYQRLIYYSLKFRRIIQARWRPLRNKFLNSFEKACIKLFKKAPLRNRAFFCSVRADDKLLENSSAVYESLSAPKIFISKRNPHNRKTRLKILYYLLTSKVIVTDDYLHYLRLVNLRKKQRIIQIWHACGAFKKFSLDCASANHEIENETHRQYSDVIVSSDDVRKHYATAFGLNINKIKSLGVPRTDMFFNENTEDMTQELYQMYPDLKDKKIILYAPTFREDHEGRRIPFETRINWEKLSNSLKDDEIFIIKKHPAMKEDLLDGQNYENIMDLSSFSIYSLMFASNIMISDYSSVIFEYSLLNRPMLFYCPDIEEYERDFYLRYPEDLPGEITYDSNQLIENIRRSLIDPKMRILNNFKKQQMDACDGKSTERVVKLIKNYLS